MKWFYSILQKKKTKTNKTNKKKTMQKDIILEIRHNVAGDDIRGKCGSYEGKTKV